MNNFEALWAHMAASECENTYVQDVIIGTGQSMLARGPNEAGGVLSTASRNTRFLSTPRVAKALSKSNFDMDALKTAKGGLSIYLCLPARMFPTHARFLRLIISLLLFRMGELGLSKPKSGHPVLFILDEFPTLGHMEMLEKAAGLMAGYWVKLWTFVQDMSQMRRLYKESWETFLGNAGTSVFFANSDMTTLDWLSRRMGETEILRETSGSNVATTTGSSETSGSSETKGKNQSETRSHAQSDMAPLSKTATIQGGGSLLDVITRRTKSPLSNSYSKGQSEGGSTQSSQSKSTAMNSSKSETQSTSQQIFKTRLMSPDEIARHFDRDTGLSIAFIGGHGPYVLRRTPYHKDPMFKGRYDEVK